MNKDEMIYRLAHQLKDLVGGDSPVHLPGERCPICPLETDADASS